jgi:pallidin
MSLNELKQYQLSLIESLHQEQNQFNESISKLDIDGMISKAYIYSNKLINIKKDMEMVKEKSKRLKKRILKLQEDKQKRALEKELEREEQVQRDKLLVPIIIKSKKNDDDTKS